MLRDWLGEGNVCNRICLSASVEIETAQFVWNFSLSRDRFMGSDVPPLLGVRGISQKSTAAVCYDPQCPRNLSFGRLHLLKSLCLRWDVCVVLRTCDFNGKMRPLTDRPFNNDHSVMTMQL